MIEKLFNFFGYKREYIWTSEFEKKDAIISKFDITITTVNGDVINVTYQEKVRRYLANNGKDFEVYDFNIYNISDYLENLHHSRSLVFPEIGVANFNPISKIDFKIIKGSSVTANVSREIKTRKLVRN